MSVVLMSFCLVYLGHLKYSVQFIPAYMGVHLAGQGNPLLWPKKKSGHAQVSAGVRRGSHGTCRAE